MALLTQPPREEEQPSAVRRASAQLGNRAKRKLLKKGAKIAAKLIKKAAIRFSAILMKMLIAAIGAIGLPVLLIVGGIILVVIIASLVLTLLFSFGGDDLSEDEAEIHAYIVEKANSTVNMNSDWEKPYRVPEGLIAASIQIDSFQTEDMESLIDSMTEKLAPTFEYGDYNEWTETYEEVYEDGELIEKSEVERTDHWVEKLNHAEYWNGSTTFSYTSHVTDWEVTEKVTYREEKYTETETQTYYEEVEQTYDEYEWVPHEEERKEEYIDYIWDIEWEGNIPKVVKKPVVKYRTVKETVYKWEPVKKTKVVEVEKNREVEVEKTRKIEVKTRTYTRHQYFTSKKTSVTDYSYFDNVLNSFNLGVQDKKLIEANYAFVGGNISYIDWLERNGMISTINNYVYFDGTIIPGESVPAQFMSFYRSAEKEYGIPWYILAAIHYEETGFSTHPTMVSSVGAIGPMQFLEATWAGWKFNIGNGLVSPDIDITNLEVIKDGGGYGVDGDGDGVADPWNEADAIHAAAKLLKNNHFNKDPRGAIFQYNKSEEYVNNVLANAEKFKTEAVYEGGEGIPALNPGKFMRPAIGTVSSPYGIRWGSMHHGIDITHPDKNIKIVAAADGVVTKSYYSKTYGEVVFIQHNINGTKYETVYAHMVSGSRTVKEGQAVKQGQVIGYMGSTGQSTGKHLHFEIHLGHWNYAKSNSINPALLINF